jgi:hypothetical protein
MTTFWGFIFILLVFMFLGAIILEEDDDQF